MAVPELIVTKDAPTAFGHYSQAVKANGFIFTALQLPVDPKDPNKEKGTIEEQVGQVIDNIFATIEAAGGSKKTIIKVTVYVANITYWEKMDVVYAKKFGKNKPARGVLQVANLRKGYDLAMEAVAVVEE